MSSSPIETFLLSEQITQLGDPRDRKALVDSLTARTTSNVIYALNAGQIDAETAGRKVQEIFSEYKEYYAL